MKRKNILIIVAIVAALFSFKALFPQAVDTLSQKAGAVFQRDINYRDVLKNIDDSIPAFFRNGGQEFSEDSVETLSAVEPLNSTEHGTVSMAELFGEEAVNIGEDPIFPETELPPVVAAFLESQKEYSDVALPENVTYTYEKFPEDNTVPVLGYNSSGFGYRTHPIHGDLRFHYGTDFAAWSGEDIYAFADGTVSFAGWSQSYGNYITIEHSDGWESLYAHCSILYVETGDEVESGQKIALVGDTGLVTGPHLHFELKHKGVYTNPEYYVN